jgi:hypothetical protein
VQVRDEGNGIVRGKPAAAARARDGNYPEEASGNNQNIEAEMRGQNDPDISVGGLMLWIHNRQFPDSTDYWDGNWVNSTARMSANGARVEVAAPFIHLGEIRRWHEEITKLSETLSGTAELAPMEPELKVAMRCDSLGHVTVEVEMTPNVISQKHWFEFEIDQSYLPALVKDLERVLEEFPVRGNPST